MRYRLRTLDLFYTHYFLTQVYDASHGNGINFDQHTHLRPHKLRVIQLLRYLIQTIRLCFQLHLRFDAGLDLLTDSRRSNLFEERRLYSRLC